jgi:hypothetical protein
MDENYLVQQLLENQPEDSDQDPIDENNVCYWIFLMYGIGMLLPWNVILSCLDFLMYEVSVIFRLVYCLFRCPNIHLRRSIHLR